MEKHRNLPEGNVGTVVPDGEVIGLLDELARLVKELTPHLDHILSDAVMAHQRHVLRDHAGKARIFDLSNDIYQFNQRMNALCSEAARKFATGKHGIDSKRP